MAVVTLRDIARADEGVERIDALTHAGHIAAIALREMYIHQAHCVIEGSLHHLDHYPEAAAAAVDSSRALSERLLGTRHAAYGGVFDAVVAVERAFRGDVVPAIASGNRAGVAAAHARLEPQVSRAAAGIEAMLEALREDADEAHTWAQETAVKGARLVLVGLGFATLLAAAVGFSLTRTIARGVGPLMEVTARLGVGDLTARVDNERTDELGRLGQAIDRMAGDLAAREDEAVRVRRTIAVAQLAAGVAHEINNPLGVILGHATLLRRAPGLSEAACEGLDVIASETAVCARIVRDLLELSREPKLVLDAVDLRDVLEDAVARARTATPAGVAIELALPRTAVVRQIDSGRIDQVLRNLIRNAIEACGLAGQVRVALDEAGRIEVRDTGPGFPAEDADRLLDPFFTTKAGGTGLGLAVSATLVRAHGGSLRAVPGPVGAVFQLELP